VEALVVHSAEMVPLSDVHTVDSSSGLGVGSSLGLVRNTLPKAVRSEQVDLVLVLEIHREDEVFSLDISYNLVLVVIAMQLMNNSFVEVVGDAGK
jgi:hypothetical protein